MTDRSIRLLVLAAALTLTSVVAQAQFTPSTVRPGDLIAAVVNDDVVTASEVMGKVEALRDEARRTGQTVPDADTLKQQALDQLINERVLITYARDAGAKVDEPEIDRAVNNVAAQNKLTIDELKQRLKAEGMDYKRFRDNLKDQMMLERVREHDVQGRIKITDAEIDKFLIGQEAKAASNPQLDIAQILVTVPEGATPEQVAERRALAEKALARVQGGEDFAWVAGEVSEDGNRQKGGEIGLRPADRLPDLFVNAVKDLKAGQILPTLVRSGAGFHVLKLLSRQAPSALNEIVQTHARHILLRPSPQLPPEMAARRLAEIKRDIEAGTITFEEAAKKNSEDGSAAEGGELGWASPGGFVPEFEEAMNGLAINGISDPVPSRFGLHLIQVLGRRTVKLEPKQLREQARTALREQKYEEAYQDWVKDLRSKAYVEMRDWNL